MQTIKDLLVACIFLVVCYYIVVLSFFLFGVYCQFTGDMYQASEFWYIASRLYNPVNLFTN